MIRRARWRIKVQIHRAVGIQIEGKHAELVHRPRINMPDMPSQKQWLKARLQ